MDERREKIKRIRRRKIKERKKTKNADNIKDRHLFIEKMRLDEKRKWKKKLKNYKKKKGNINGIFKKMKMDKRIKNKICVKKKENKRKLYA